MRKYFIMAHYKHTEKGQGLLLAVNLSEQIIPGTFEYTLEHLIDQKLDLQIFDYKYKNDYTGAPAIKPRILLKIILYCYSLGIISSRKIAKLCKNHILVKALAEDTEPHYTTLSDFVSGMSDEIEIVFAEILLVCDEMGLIKGKMFAVDGCKLPSNASKEYSGTKKELQEKYSKLKKLSKKILEKHKHNDKIGKKEFEADTKKLERLENKAQKILEFLSTHEDRKGASGQIIQYSALRFVPISNDYMCANAHTESNITDNESGKIKCSDGVIQGYNGIAVADSKDQVIIAANAYGTVAEGQYFGEMLDQTEKNMKETSKNSRLLLFHTGEKCSPQYNV